METAVTRRITRAATAMATAAALARAVVGCTTTPTLDFVRDASVVDPVDSAVPPPLSDASDASSADAADDADDADDAADARVPRNTCPDAAPPNVASCCGRVRCVGKGCAEARCDECRVCAVSSVCCIKKVDAAADCVVNIQACK